MTDLNKSQEIEQLLRELIEPQLAQLLSLFRDSPDGNPFFVHIPDLDTVDIPIENIASLVARTSNSYASAARFAGIARAQVKLAKGRYERTYKKNRAKGKNDDERQANAMEMAEADHSSMITAEAIAEVAEAYESAARIASESIRKIFDKAGSMVMGQIREAHGSYKDSDFRPY